MIILGFGGRTDLVGRSQVFQLVCTTEFERPNVLGDPAFAHSVNFSATDHTHACGPLPDLKPSMWRELSPACGPQVLNFDERHGVPPSQSGSWGGAIVIVTPTPFVFEMGKNSLKQTFPLGTLGFTGGNQV
ncbi:MAG TPA: hypothetical protein VEZ16_14820 [Microvirga sp.]|nr:hypothetical protein [Microvirga sp.]